MQNSTVNTAIIIDNLATQGYAIVEDFLPTYVIAQLADEAKARDAHGALQPAKTGLAGQLANAEIRGDSIAWLSEQDDFMPIKLYFSQMHALKNAFNEALFLNLASLETHFAIYQIGAKYGKHLDQFNAGRGLQVRQISSILYLNQHWQAADGGELRMYLHEDNLSSENLPDNNLPDDTLPIEKYLDIAPIGGRLVLFKSSEFWHEVMPTTRERISLTGWFRARELR
jgi:SM-20-related protein